MTSNSLLSAPIISSSAMNALGSATAKNTPHLNDQQINKASQEFESMFVSMMLEHMYGESEGDEAFGNEETSNIYRGLLMEEYGKQISRSGGIGIAQYVKQELLKLQEVSS